ncbi:hypothetical protein LTR36_002562 [Oleoguttula mirabilis]|uniref:Peroxisomal targeting signal receptor n=1 Tax=Oleoguttula mirabilis TaxID=1507867 RepID=A0AAV9JJL3_9PEZI|nr:hypothetical protein LTR36_002562 [Oleoguttula mirabilis]
MSFLGGPECSTGANPLAQFQKQTSADTSLQRDRLTGRAPQYNGFRTQPGLPEDAAFQDFQHQGPQLGEALPNEAFHLEQLRREQEHIERTGGGGGGGHGWAGEFAQQPPQFNPGQGVQLVQPDRNGAFSPQDFAQFRQAQLSPIQRNDSPSFQQSAYQRPPMYGNSMGGGFGMQRPMMYQGQQQQMFSQQEQQDQYQGKGKGRIQELSDTDWEKQFEELSTEDKDAAVDMEALDREAERAVEAELNGLDRDMMADGELAGHFGDEYDQWKDFDGMSHDFDGLRTHDYTRGPQLGNYLFEENNLFNDVPNAFEEGQKIMREGGNLSLAALAFEAAIQRDADFVEAWVALGQAQAQNEKESPAIRALEQALKLDPNNLEALMGLSVSYTNEGYDSLAYRTLERWIGVKYPSLGVTPRGLDEAAAAEEEMGFTDRHLLHDKVTGLFLEAAQIHPEGADVDVDVQVGLGVLFYGSEDYDKAVDCFTAALDSAQHGALKREGEEHLLWNRLGATLANSGRSEEAIEAYNRALELRANFVRARYNLGVSCINLGALEAAAGHLLNALSMHRLLESEGRAKAAELLKDGRGNDVDDAVVEGLLQQNQSTNLYDTLRRVYTQMGRRDLAERVGPDMDLDGMRSEVGRRGEERGFEGQGGRLHEHWNLLDLGVELEEARSAREEAKLRSSALEDPRDDEVPVVLRPFAVEACAARFNRLGVPQALAEEEMSALFCGGEPGRVAAAWERERLRRASELALDLVDRREAEAEAAREGEALRAAPTLNWDEFDELDEDNEVREGMGVVWEAWQDNSEAREVAKAAEKRREGLAVLIALPLWDDALMGTMGEWLAFSAEIMW